MLKSFHSYSTFRWLHSMVYTNIRDFQFRGVPEKLLTSVTQKQKHAIHVCFGSLFWVVVIFVFVRGSFCQLFTQYCQVLVNMKNVHLALAQYFSQFLDDQKRMLYCIYIRKRIKILFLQNLFLIFQDSLFYSTYNYRGFSVQTFTKK